MGHLPFSLCLKEGDDYMLHTYVACTKLTTTFYLSDHNGQSFQGIRSWPLPFGKVWVALGK